MLKKQYGDKVAGGYKIKSQLEEKLDVYLIHKKQQKNTLIQENKEKLRCNNVKSSLFNFYYYSQAITWQWHFAGHFAGQDS
jgi:hypothetical protein